MKSLVTIPTYNEERNIDEVLSRFTPGLVDEIVVVNDGSTDKTKDIIEKFDVTVINHDSKRGIGSCIRDGIEYAIKNGFDIISVMAGNGKDNPREIPGLMRPIIEEGYDYVQGSRYLEGGRSENTPFSRTVTTKLCTLAWQLTAGFKGTDASNGFRAYRSSIFNNPQIDIKQSWLDKYELEYYIHYKVISLGYKITEVPVSKNYPSKKNYSKIRPVVDWWGIMRPLIYLRLGIKR